MYLISISNPFLIKTNEVVVVSGEITTGGSLAVRYDKSKNQNQKTGKGEQKKVQTIKKQFKIYIYGEVYNVDEYEGGGFGWADCVFGKTLNELKNKLKEIEKEGER